MEKEINIQNIISVALKKWWIILLCVVVCGALFYVYSSYFIPDQFTSTGSVYADSKADKIINIDPQFANGDTTIENNHANLQELATAEMLVDTYIEILSSKR